MSVSTLAEKKARAFIDGDTIPDADLLARANRLNRLYEGVSGAELLRSMIDREFRGKIALVSSFGAESSVLLHLAAEVDPSIPVIFLDTGKLFGETLRYRDKLAERLGLTDVRSIKPLKADEDHLDPQGILWSQDTDACCAFRKVEPLNRALEGFDAWITGRKRFQSASRATIPLVEASSTHIKINPLAAWGEEDVQRHMAQHDLPAHPLVEDGYLSIGCMPCTDRVAPGADPRSGRWAGQDKTECGIHIPETFVDGGGI